jgi:hypothetical protein
MSRVTLSPGKPSRRVGGFSITLSGVIRFNISTASSVKDYGVAEM